MLSSLLDFAVLLSRIELTEITLHNLTTKHHEILNGHTFDIRPESRIFHRHRDKVLELYSDLDSDCLTTASNILLFALSPRS